MTITARLSLFDKKFLPVENPVEFLRAAKKRLGKPSRRKTSDGKIVYDFVHFFGFDKLTIIVDRPERRANIPI